MNVQLKAGEPQSAVVARVDGSEVHFTDGLSLILDARKDVAIFNGSYVPGPEPVNNIPTSNWAGPPRAWRISDLWRFK